MVHPRQRMLANTKHTKMIIKMQRIMMEVETSCSCFEPYPLSD